MYSDEISSFNNLIKGTNLYAHILSTFFVDEWVIADNLHVKCQCTLCNTTADTAHTDNAQSLALQLNTGVLLAVPLTLLESFISNCNITGHSHHHSEGMLSSGDGITTWGVDYDDTTSSSSRYINVINTYTSTANNLQVLSSCDYLSGNFGSRANDKSIKFRDNLQQFLSRELILFHTLEIGKDVNGFLRYAISD